jgi:P-type conjugative transfer protein TrbJ
MRRNFKVRKTITAVVLCLSLAALAPKAHAVLPVTDAGSITQQLIAYAMQAQQYTNQVQQLQNQYQQLLNDAQNLRNLNWQAPLSDLNQVAQIMQNASGIASSFASAQAQFQELYPDFNHYSGMQGAAYLNQASSWLRQNRNAALDTTRVQARLRDAFSYDQNTLNNASNRSAAAQGTRDALQAGNQLLALQTKQLMQLQQLLSATASMDAGYAAERASKEAAAQQRNKDRFWDWTHKGTRNVRSSFGTLR